MNLTQVDEIVHCAWLDGEMSYDNREAIKGYAWGVLSRKSSLDNKAFAISFILKAHYWRCLEDFERFPKRLREKILGEDFDDVAFKAGLPPYVYENHWFYANRSLIGTLIPADAADRYMYFAGRQPMQSRYMRDGATGYSRICASK